MPQVCKKCGYKRKPTDSTPDYECPSCGANYVRVELQLRKKEDEIKKKLERESKEKAARPKIVTKTYNGRHDEANSAFRNDAHSMATNGYYPISQNWVPGAYGSGAFLLALLLCLVFVGIIVFIYMLIVKPPGTLMVTYELRESDTSLTPDDDTKTCPRCAENIKQAALVCRYCGFEFQNANS